MRLFNARPLARQRSYFLNEYSYRYSDYEFAVRIVTDGNLKGQVLNSDWSVGTILRTHEDGEIQKACVIKFLI